MLLNPIYVAGLSQPPAPEKFVAAYIDCALWSSADDEGEPLDSLDLELSPEARAAMDGDCAAFIAYCEETGVDPFPDYGHPEYSNLEMSGHDFWLTRNGHGAGYWDRGLETGEELTRAAKTFGSCGLYVGDDGQIHAS